MIIKATLSNRVHPEYGAASIPFPIPRPGVEFVARMEDVLDAYQHPYDPLRPVVCLDETNRRLIEKRSIKESSI